MFSRPRLASLDDLRAQEAELRKEQKKIITNDRLSSRDRKARFSHRLCPPTPLSDAPVLLCTAPRQHHRRCSDAAPSAAAQDLAQIESKLGRIREDKGEIKRLQREEKIRAAKRGAAAAAAEAAGSPSSWGLLGSSWWGGDGGGSKRV